MKPCTVTVISHFCKKVPRRLHIIQVGKVWRPHLTLDSSSNMPRNCTSSLKGFDTRLLDPDGLTTPGGLRGALRSVERVFREDDFLIMEMIEGLICQPHTFEYITSSMFLILVIAIH